MTKRDEQLGLEHFLVTTLGEKNRLRIRKVIEENTPELEGTSNKEWKLQFSRRVLAALDGYFQAEMGSRATNSRVQQGLNRIKSSPYREKHLKSFLPQGTPRRNQVLHPTTCK